MLQALGLKAEQLDPVGPARSPPGKQSTPRMATAPSPRLEPVGRPREPATSKRSAPKPASSATGGSRFLIVGVLIALGVLWQLPGLLKRPAPTPPPPPSLSRHQVTVNGRLSLAPEAGGSLEGARVIFHFPELTLDLERPVSELNLQPDGSFTATLTLEASQVPRRVSLTARRPGCQDITLTEVNLAGGQATAPALALKPLRKLPSEPPERRPRLARDEQRKGKAHQKMLEVHKERKKGGSPRR